MKRVSQFEYNNYLKSIEELEKQLSDIRKYKGEVAIYQGDNWHDNPILYQTELKESSLMKQLQNLREKVYSMEIIKERTSNMLSIDDILEPNIVGNLDIPDKIKSEIKANQNMIIEYPQNSKLFVNGLDGTGLNDILLYRIAYLIYSSNNKLEPDDILLINPNDQYSGLIKERLKMFTTDEITQKSIISFISDYLDEKLSLYAEDDEFEKYKMSKTYGELLEKFIRNHIQEVIVSENLEICDEILFDKEEIREALFKDSKITPNYDWACMYFSNKYKSNFELLSDKITRRYADVYRNMSLNDPERKYYVDKAYKIKKEFKENGNKIIKRYFKKINRKTSDIYSLFVSNLHLMIGEDMEKIKTLQCNTLKTLKKHKISVGDIYSLLYIRFLITNETVPEKHVILSEFQNYGKDFVNILEKICANSGITVFCRNGEVVQDYNGFDVINLIDEYEKENTDLDRCNVPFEKIKK